jgi:hypothetical protein
MELLHFELKARGTENCFGFAVVLLATACLFGFMVYSDDAVTKVSVGLFAAFWAFACVTYIYSFVTNPNCEFGIRDDTIWWDEPGWRRSVGKIAIDEVCKVRILEGSHKLHIIMRDGTSRRIRCLAAQDFPRACKLRDVLVTNYPHIEVELIEAPG